MVPEFLFAAWADEFSDVSACSVLFKDFFGFFGGFDEGIDLGNRFGFAHGRFDMGEDAGGAVGDGLKDPIADVPAIQIGVMETAEAPSEGDAAAFVDDFRVEFRRDGRVVIHQADGFQKGDLIGAEVFDMGVALTGGHALVILVPKGDDEFLELMDGDHAGNVVAQAGGLSDDRGAEDFASGAMEIEDAVIKDFEKSFVTGDVVHEVVEDGVAAEFVGGGDGAFEAEVKMDIFAGEGFLEGLAVVDVVWEHAGVEPIDGFLKGMNARVEGFVDMGVGDFADFRKEQFAAEAVGMSVADGRGGDGGFGDVLGIGINLAKEGQAFAIDFDGDLWVEVVVSADGGVCDAEQGVNGGADEPFEAGFLTERVVIR